MFTLFVVMLSLSTTYIPHEISLLFVCPCLVKSVILLPTIIPVLSPPPPHPHRYAVLELPSSLTRSGTQMSPGAESSPFTVWDALDHCKYYTTNCSRQKWPSASCFEAFSSALNFVCKWTTRCVPLAVYMSLRCFFF